MRKTLTPALSQAGRGSQSPVPLLLFWEKRLGEVFDPLCEEGLQLNGTHLLIIDLLNSNQALAWGETEIDRMRSGKAERVMKRGTNQLEQKGYSKRDSDDWSWRFWQVVPLYPYGKRRTLRREIRQRHDLDV